MKNFPTRLLPTLLVASFPSLLFASDSNANASLIRRQRGAQLAQHVAGPAVLPRNQLLIERMKAQQLPILHGKILAQQSQQRAQQQSTQNQTELPPHDLNTVVTTPFQAPPIMHQDHSASAAMPTAKKAPAQETEHAPQSAPVNLEPCTAAATIIRSPEIENLKVLQNVGTTVATELTPYPFAWSDTQIVGRVISAFRKFSAGEYTGVRELEWLNSFDPTKHSWPHTQEHETALKRGAQSFITRQDFEKLHALYQKQKEKGATISSTKSEREQLRHRIRIEEQKAADALAKLVSLKQCLNAARKAQDTSPDSEDDSDEKPYAEIKKQLELITTEEQKTE